MKKRLVQIQPLVLVGKSKERSPFSMDPFPHHLPLTFMDDQSNQWYEKMISGAYLGEWVDVGVSAFPSTWTVFTSCT
ncbi:hypothetical protein HMI56_002997 [Coelomomyces lativittatus]|nr:hypothetical protein HMI56_002997 [Coelomomyces lativittatus]